MASERTDLARPPAVPDSLTRLGYKIRRFGPLPEGFNPLTATDNQLADQRLPRRPDAQTEPRLHALWERSMTQTKTWIAPEFAQFDRGVRRAPGLPITTSKPLIESPGGALVSSNWSGALQQAKTGHPYTFVAGQWTVPHLDLAPTLETDFAGFMNGDTWLMAEWVGIDGWWSKELLQAGTFVQPIVERNAFGPELIKIATWAWWEWWPNVSVAITNLRVSPGDVVVCLICADDTMTGAVIYFSNLTTGRGTHFHVTPPHGKKLEGTSAEWIVERPTMDPQWPQSWWESPYVAHLPDYVECYINDCAAGGSGYDSDLNDAFSVTMVSAKHKLLSLPEFEDDVTLKLSWWKDS